MAKISGDIEALAVQPLRCRNGLIDEEDQVMSQDWGKFRDQWMKGASKKGVSRDKVPDKTCGYCENFTRN